jgi:hypothetical protein
VLTLTLILTLTLTEQETSLTSSPGATCSMGKPCCCSAAPADHRRRWAAPSELVELVELADLHRAVMRGLTSHLEPTRRWRAHVQASALAGEEARGGAIASAAVARRKKERLRGAKVTGLGFSERRARPGVLTRRNRRATVDYDRTVAVVPRACGTLPAQAGHRFPGPGPGCGLVRGSAPRARGCRVELGHFGLFWAVLGQKNSKFFSIFSEIIFDISCMV